MGKSSARRLEQPISAVPPVTSEDENVQLSRQAEEDRLRRQRGTRSSIHRSSSTVSGRNQTGIVRAQGIN